MARESTAIAREYPPGTVLFQEKDPGGHMYVIRSGRVKIYKSLGQQELVLAFLGDGDFFGEMALLEGLPRSASAVVVESSVIVEVDAEAFESMIHRNPGVAIRMMRKLASRVRNLDGRLEKMMVDSAQERALEVLRWLLPQGIIEAGWIRVRGIVPHFDIAAQAGIPPSKSEAVVRRLQAARCLEIDGADMLIAEKQVLDTYASYLALKREYQPALDDDAQTGDAAAHPGRAMRNLMHALRLSEDEIETRQADMRGKYERYRQLQQRFKDFDKLK